MDVAVRRGILWQLVFRSIQIGKSHLMPELALHNLSIDGLTPAGDGADTWLQSLT